MASTTGWPGHGAAEEELFSLVSHRLLVLNYIHVIQVGVSLPESRGCQHRSETA